jgi:hypothetical protein
LAVENTKKQGNQVANKYNNLQEGDPVLVKSTLRIKIRLDGTRLIIPPLENHRHSKYTFKARIKEIKGNCYNLIWGQDSPELGLMGG